MTMNDWRKVGVNRWHKNGMIVDVSVSNSDFHYLTKLTIQ